MGRRIGAGRVWRLPLGRDLPEVVGPAEIDIIGEVADHLLIALDGPGRIIAHPEVIPVPSEPLRKIPPLHALIFRRTHN